MVKNRIKFAILISILVLVCFLSTKNITFISASSIDEELITTRNAFINALNEAKDGDVLLVGDIDFNLNYTGAVNIVERIDIEKSVTIKSGKKEENAIFKGASFILNGTKIGGECSFFTFEEITFDDGLDTSILTNEDWELTYDSMNEPISFYPLKNQYAIQCKGNTNANFKNCEFKNYMHTYGPAIRAFYADYTLTPSLEAEHGDNVPYKLELTIDKCNFSSNASLYGGGAVYVEANSKNVTLNVKDCNFMNNKSGFVQNSVGGGAVYVKNTIASFDGCIFEKNDANYYYGGERFWADKLCGGAIGCSDRSDISIRNCKIIDNKASFGGGIGITEESNVYIEDCYIIDNKAISECEDKRSTYGLASEQGIGGAIYLNGNINVTIANTEIRNNYAENAIGAIFTDYNPSLDYSYRKVKLLFCTIENNICKTKITDYVGYKEDRWIWFSWYTDFFDISYLDYYGNLVADELYETHYPKNEQPTEENGFNFFGSTVSKEWYNEEGHLVHAPIVPIDFIKEKLGNRNYYGTFTVGVNNHDVTFKFYMDGVCKETITLPSGVSPIRPSFEKTGYTLTSWELAEEFDYQPNRYFIVGNETKSVDFYAVFTPNTYKITFDYEIGHSVDLEQTYDTKILFPELVEKTGYTFCGWFTEKNGEGSKIQDGDLFTIASDVIFYAYYEKNFPITMVLIITFAIIFTCGLITLAFIVFKYKKQPILIAGESSEIIEKEEPDISMLSPREKEVLALLLEGKQRNEIAATLYISENTVKKQITSIYSKLGVTSRSELFALFK